MQSYDLHCSDSKFVHLPLDNAEHILANLTMYSASSDKAEYGGLDEKCVKKLYGASYS